MSIGTAFHDRTAPLNRKMQWREWSGYFASSAYADAHDIEYNAIREAAALIDVSPLFKYHVSGPDAQRLVDRVITRDASRLARGQVFYTPWCDEHGKVLDDGTIHRLDDDSYRWTVADPQLRWFRLNTRGLDVSVEEDTDRVAALALQGPLARAMCSRRLCGRSPPTCATSAAVPRRIGETLDPNRREPHRLYRRPGLRAVDRRLPCRGAVGRAH